jgi:protein-disulfide isomerase
MKNKSLILVSVVVLLAIFFGGGYYYNKIQTQKSQALKKEQALLFERPYSIVIGKKDAKVQLVEFFDPACGTCAHFHPYIKDILKEYKDDIKLVLRYAPFHKNSDYAVKMLIAANEQGKFIEALELMFYTQQYWVQHHVVNPNILWNILDTADILDMEKLKLSMDDPKADEMIKQDLADAKTLGQSKTPGYIVNGKPLQEFGLENLLKLIKSEINK